MMQISTDVPKPSNNTPIDLSNPLEVVVYVVIPIVLLAIYFGVRRKARAKSKNSGEHGEAQ